MKRNFWLIGTLLLLFLLVGCLPDIPPGTEPLPTVSVTKPQPSIPTTLPSESIPEEADVFYFCNQLEYDRLYRMRLDGSGLELVMDESCWNVQQQGDTVYYLCGNELAAYHIPTAARGTLVTGVTDYRIDGPDLVYAVEGDEYFTRDIRWLDLESGEDRLLLTLETPIFALGDGVLYYTAYEYESFGHALYAFDLKANSQKLLCGPQGYAGYYQLIPYEGGVCCKRYSNDQEKWIYVPADGSPIQDMPQELPLSSQLISVGDSGILFVDNGSTYDSIPALSHLSPDRNITVIAQTERSGIFTITQLPGSNWLVSKGTYTGWGEITEYGNYEHMSYQQTHFLLSGSLEVTPLDVTGPMGAMFQNGDFPILDSSTARIPVTTALYDLFVMGYGYEGPEPLCSTTHGAWLNIADKKVDLALLAAPTPEEQAYLESKGVEVEMKLYGGDGLVFIGNTANPVSDLSHEQLIAIYRGEITNWSQLGGPDEPIRVYFRDDQSGSQRLFENLLFKDQTLPDFYALGFPMIDTMSDIVNTVLHDPYSIGYSIMTYLDEVYAEEALKVFTVNGVYPSPETVKDQSYPYNTKGYLVIRSDEPEDSPARRLFNWFGCPVSDDLLKRCGVTPLSE